MKLTQLRDIIAATHTPFYRDGSLNLGAVERQAQHLLANGVVAAFIGGTTGESHSLSLEERRALTARWIEVTRGTALGVIVHVGSNCLADARNLATQAQQLGASAISAVAPAYFKPKTLTALIEGCAEIAAAAPDLPFYHYDIPSMTGVSLPMHQFLEQAGRRIPNLAGLKFSNPDLMMFQQILHADGGRWSAAWGSDECLLAALALGCTSAVGSTYNFCAPVARRVWNAFGRGDLIAARQEQYRVVQVVDALIRRGYMGASKALMTMLDVPVGPARLPNTNLDAEGEASLRKELDSLGFWDWIRA